MLLLYGGIIYGPQILSGIYACLVARTESNPPFRKKARKDGAPTVWLGIDEAKSFTTEGTADHGKNQVLPLMTLTSEADNCAGLQFTRVIGHMIWAGFTARLVLSDR